MPNTWANTKPTETGWFWCRDIQIKKPFVIYIFDLQLIVAGYQWAKINEPKEIDQVNEE